MCRFLIVNNTSDNISYISYISYRVTQKCPGHTLLEKRVLQLFKNPEKLLNVLATLKNL
jgi:hypothetical protein